MPRCPYATRLTLLSALAATLIATTAQAVPQNTDFSGAWRLDDRNSDTADTLTAALRSEAHKELASSQQTTATPPSPNVPPADQRPGGGHRGGGVGGGEGMGHGGGHSHRGGGDSKPAPAGDKAPIASASYPMPPLLGADGVLLVQQDAKTFQVRLSNGDQLTGKLDGQAHQSLNGNAMVRGHVESGRLLVSIQYADGTRLEQTWTLSPDGRQLVVDGAWKIPALQQPVHFRRSYVGLH